MIAFSINGDGIIRYSYVKRKKMNLDPYFSPYRKTNLKWIIDQNVKHETLKLLKENSRENILDYVKSS